MRLSPATMMMMMNNGVIPREAKPTDGIAIHGESP